MSVIPLTLEKPLKGSLILKVCWCTPLQMWHWSLWEVPVHLVCFPCWRRSSLCSGWTWGVAPSGACSYLDSDQRDWWTKSSGFAAGQVKNIIYPLGCGVSLLWWDSAGSVLQGFKREQRRVSKIRAPSFQSLDCSLREIPQGLELLLYRWINSFQEPVSHWAFLSVWIYCWKRSCKVLIWTNCIFPVTVQGLAQARNCSNWSSDVVTLWSPCFGGWDILMAWPWADNCRWPVSQKTVTFNKLLLR